MTKTLLRKIILQYRRMLSEKEYVRRNHRLNEQLIDFILTKEVTSIHTFLPITKNREFDIRPIIPKLRESGIKIMVSKTNFKTHSLKHYWLTEHTQLIENSLGIPEPTGAEEANISEAELIVVPLIMADKAGNRIGYGGGYYDELLKSFEGDTVGVSLTTLFDELGTDPWDVPVKQMLFFDRK